MLGFGNTFKVRKENAFYFVNSVEGMVISYLKMICLAYRDINDLGNEATQILVLFL